MYTYLGAKDGDGRGTDYLPGIPARDIEDAEAREQGWTETLKVSPLYEHEDDAPPTKAKASVSTSEGGD